jgi:hypothetical protein
LSRFRVFPSRPHKLAIWVRLMAAFVLAIVTSGSTLAWAMPCCAHDERSDTAESDAPSKGDGCCPGKSKSTHDANAVEDSDDSDDEGSCSCPVSCSPCCSGTAGVALVPIPELEARLLPGWTILELTDPDRLPPDGEIGDVLHVPKRARSPS